MLPVKFVEIGRYKRIEPANITVKKPDTINWGGDNLFMKNKQLL